MLDVMKPDFCSSLTFYSLEEGGPKNGFTLGWIRLPLVVLGADHYFDVHIEFENQQKVFAGMSVEAKVFMLAPENISFFPKGREFYIWNLRPIGKGIVV